jgi:type I restriction enzyme S subunit
MNLAPYKEYRATKIHWLGDVPAHWDVRPLRTVLLQRNEKNSPVKTEQILSLSIAHGVTLYSHEGRGGNKRKADVTAYKIARAGDIVLNSMNVIVGAVGLSRYTGAISPVYYALFPATDEVDIRYYDKVFENSAFQRYLLIYGKGILIKKSSTGKLNTIRMKISPEDLKSTLLPIPPKQEQRQIARFLDWESSRIKKFIRNKRRLIELLKEQKQNIINQAVTRGLDPNVKLKPSGVEWIGDIPAHWEARRLRTLAAVRASGVDKNTNEDEVPVMLCNYVDVYKNERITAAIDFMKATATLEEIRAFELKADDVIITKDSESWDDIAVPTFVPEAIPGVVCAYHLALIRPFSCEIEGEFLFRAFSSDLVAEQFRIAATGVTRFGLAQGAIKGAFFPLPPLEEQRAITAHINGKCAEIDQAIARAEREIELIREYRTRLISDVVTGQMDVRDIEVPEVTEEELQALDDAPREDEELVDDEAAAEMAQ